MENCLQSNQEMLVEYTDGVLPSENQVQLFMHLSTCETCRNVLDGVLTFRRWSRVESIQVPPQVDERILQKLDEIKDRDTGALVDPSLWNSKMSMTLRTWLFAAAIVFAFGITLQAALGPSNDMNDQASYVNETAQPIYVFYPGVTVEAEP